MEFLSLQKDHGYINLPDKEGGAEATPPKQNGTRGSVKRTSRRKPRSTETGNGIDTPPLLPKKDPSITKQSSETPNSNHANGKQHMPPKPPKAAPPETIDTPPEMDTPPPPLPPRQFIKKDDQTVNSQTPPPLPARNYCEEDLLELQNKDTPTIEVESSLSHEDDDSSPPPIPAQTELSTQLVTPPTLQEQQQHFIYSSNLSDLSIMGGRRGDKPVEPISPPIPIPQGDEHPGTIEGSSQPLLYDVITEPRSRVSGVVGVASGVVGVASEDRYSTLNNKIGNNETVRESFVGVASGVVGVATENSYSTLNNGVVSTTRDKVGVVTMRSAMRVVPSQSQEQLLYDEIPTDTARGVATLRSSVQSNVRNDSDANLLYDEVYDPNVRPLSNVTNTRPSGEETCYNRLNYTPGAQGNKPPAVDSSVGSDQPILYDEVVEPNNRMSVARRSVAVTKPPPSLADHNDALYDEVHLEGPAQSLDRNPAPLISKPLEGSFYEELDHVSKPIVTTPESRRRAVTTDSSTRTTKPSEPPLPEPRVTPSSQRRALGRMGGSFPAPLQSPPPPPFQGSPRPLSPSDRPPAAIPSSEPTPLKKKGSKKKSKPSRHPTKGTTSAPPTNNSKDSPVQAYEVVPLNQHPSKPPSPIDTNSDDIFMTVNHEKQRQRFERFGGSLRNPGTPSVPSRKTETDVSRTKSAFLHSSNPCLDKDDANYDRLNHIQAIVSTTAVTLPRNLSQTPFTRESTYSTLKLSSEEKARMRAGVQVHGSKMTNSASDLADRNSSQDSSEEGFMSLIHAPNAPGASIKKRHHFYEDFGEGNEPARLIARRHSNPVISDFCTELVFAPDGPTSHSITRKPHLYEDCARDDDHKAQDKSIDPLINEVSTNEKIPLVFAPSVPSPTVKHKPHLYEEVEKEAGQLGDTPTLAWDDDLVPKQDGASGFTGGDYSPKMTKPNSVSDEDYQKRLQRLDQHYYPEIDIPIWPDQEPVLVSPSPKPEMDIQKVVRDSWLPAKEMDQDLPDGWTKEINEQGQEFYWHIPTGKIQYVKPLAGVPPRLSKVMTCNGSSTCTRTCNNTSTHCALCMCIVHVILCIVHCACQCCNV